MIVNGKDVVAVEIFAKGHYSGKIASHFGFMLKEDYEEYKDDIHSYTACFYDLDGKHSEVEGKVFVYDDFPTFADKFQRQTDDWKFTEGLLESVAEDAEEVERLANISDDFYKLLTYSNTVTVQFGDENTITF